MNPVIQSPGQASENTLRIECARAISPSGEHNLLFVGYAVVIGILEKEQVRSATDRDASTIAMNSRRPAEVFRKNGSLVETTIAIGIHQAPDLAASLFAVVIVIHLDDEKTAILVERERDWIDDEWFSDDEFQMKTLSHLKSLQ